MKRKLYRLIPFFILLFSIKGFGQKGEVFEKEIMFPKGKSSATVKGIVKDRLDSHIFHLKAMSGQKMTVIMTSSRSIRDAYLCVNFPLTEDGESESVCKKKEICH